MATTKKKPTTKKTTTARKPAISKKPKTVANQSFRQSNEKTPFFTYKFTEQSVYWLILCALVLALGSWVMYLNVKIQNIYDQVEMNTHLNENYIVPAIKKAHGDTTLPQ